MNIVVLAGGLSPERDVSLGSSCLIANALMENGHRVLLVELYGGVPDAATFEEAFALHHKDRYEFQVPEEEPDLEALRRDSGNGRALIGPNVLGVCATADVTFLGLHGSIGENGQLQAVLDVHGIAYTGSGYSGSLLAMDKLISKQLMRFHGIPTPDWVVLNGDSSIPASIGLPCVMKPCSCGSSVGVTIVETPDQWEKALAYARRYEGDVFVERKVTGREFSIGILEDRALPIIEIIPKAGFYDYRNKYQAGYTEEITPAHLDAEMTRRLQEAALAVHRALGLGIYSRVDFLLDGDGRFYCLEANTLPGMTPTSLLPQEAAAAGISYNQLCERLVQAAVK